MNRFEQLQGPQGQGRSAHGPMEWRISRWRLYGGEMSRLHTREIVLDEKKKKKKARRKRIRVRGGAPIALRRKSDRNQQNLCLAPWVREEMELDG
jgi:hypothetical protein